MYGRISYLIHQLILLAQILLATVKSTCFEKSQVSVCLARKTDGTKLPPIIFFKTVTDKELKNRIISSSPNGWTNIDLNQIWVNKAISSFSFRY